VGDRIYVFSGDTRHTDEQDDYHTLSTWDAFNVTTNAWESTRLGPLDRTMPLIENWGQAVAMPEEATAVGSYGYGPRPQNKTQSVDSVSGGLMKKSPSDLWVRHEEKPLKKAKTMFFRVVVMRGFVAYSFDLQSRSWTRLPDMKRDRSYFRAVVINKEIYAIGTYSLLAAGSNEKFNFSTNQWTPLPAMPQKARTVGAASFRDKLFIIGGVDDFSAAPEAHALNAVYYFVSSSSSWAKGPSLLMPRYRHSAVEYMGRLWVAGGRVNGLATNTVEVLSDESGVWAQGPAMVRRRDFLDLVVAGDKLYAVGGDVDDSESMLVRTIEVLDGSAADPQWKLVTNFPNERKGFAAAVLSP
jgi:hypothetical protein